MKLDKIFIDKNIKYFWNKTSSKELFEQITTYIKEKETNSELLGKMMNYFIN